MGMKGLACSLQSSRGFFVNGQRGLGLELCAMSRSLLFTEKASWEMLQSLAATLEKFLYWAKGQEKARIFLYPWRPSHPNCGTN